MSVSPLRARSKSFAARSKAAGGRSDGVPRGSAVPLVVPEELGVELAASVSIGTGILVDLWLGNVNDTTR